MKSRTREERVSPTESYPYNLSSEEPKFTDWKDRPSAQMTVPAFRERSPSSERSINTTRFYPDHRPQVDEHRRKLINTLQSDGGRDSYTLLELRKMLSDRDLSTRGSRQDLARRLLENH